MKFAELRRKMVDSQIRTADVARVSVLSAFLEVPREIFVPDKLRHLAYLDGALELVLENSGESPRFMMAPSSLARLVQLAEISEKDHVLTIGAADGYCAAILSRIAESVIALEKDTKLAENAAKICYAAGYSTVVFVTGELVKGWTELAPYNVIFLEGAVDYIPQSLFEQLKEGGRLIAVEGHGNAARACLYHKHKKSIFCRFCFNIAIPSLDEFLKKKEFIFYPPRQ